MIKKININLILIFIIFIILILFYKISYKEGFSHCTENTNSQKCLEDNTCIWTGQECIDDIYNMPHQNESINMSPQNESINMPPQNDSINMSPQNDSFNMSPQNDSFNMPPQNNVLNLNDEIISPITKKNKEILENTDKNYYVKNSGIVGDKFTLGKDLELEYVSDNPNIDNFFLKNTFIKGNVFNSGKDNNFQELTKCNSENQYILHPHINYDNSDGIITLGADRICEDVTECNFDKEYISEQHTMFSDRICSELSSCGKFKKLEGNTKTKNGVCVNIGEIMISLRFNQIDDTFMKTKKYVGNLKSFQNNLNIKNYFSNLKTTEENIKDSLETYSELQLGMDKDKKLILDDIIPCHYLSLNNYVSYLFDLRNEIVKGHFYKKHKYLNISSIEKLYKNVYGPLYLLVFGKESIIEPMRLYNCKNVNFVIAYKDQKGDIENTNNLFFEIIKYDLNMFYDYNKEVALSEKINDANYLSNFLKKINENKKSLNFINSIYSKKDIDIINTNAEINYKNKKYYANQVMESLIRCDFNAFGETLFECKDKCKIKQNCSTIDCNLICENCSNDNCLWTIKHEINVDLLSPEKIYVKGFTGNSLIKLTWIKPNSPSEILRYYIVISSPIDIDFLQIYSLYDDRELCEYFATELENEKPYDIYIFAKNNVGISKKSNKITVVPNEDSELKLSNSDTYSNSIENYYKKKGIQFDMKKQASTYERNSIINDLKNIIRNDLKLKVPTKSFNINVF